MKPSKIGFLVGLASLIALSALVVTRFKQPSQSAKVSVLPKQAETASSASLTPPPIPVAEPKPELSAEAAPPANEVEISAPKPITIISTNNVARVAKPKEPIKDPDARVALSLVGIDPEAEAYWFNAINDPSLSAHERQDLIEDLNEDGLSDPKHPGAEDLPLILSRIQLIELVGANPMDKVNEEAFQEAYKDLVTMAGKLVGQ